MNSLTLELSSLRAGDIIDNSNIIEGDETEETLQNVVTPNEMQNIRVDNMGRIRMHMSTEDGLQMDSITMGLAQNSSLEVANIDNMRELVMNRITDEEMVLNCQETRQLIPVSNQKQVIQANGYMLPTENKTSKELALINSTVGGVSNNNRYYNNLSNDRNNKDGKLKMRLDPPLITVVNSEDIENAVPMVHHVNENMVSKL